MKLTANTILITGGSSGLGLEMSRRFLEAGNKVIICSRDAAKLENARHRYPALVTFTCDISRTEDCLQLAAYLKTSHPDLNVLINNAAVVNRGAFTGEATSLIKAETEIQTNFLAPVRLSQLLYPLLATRRSSAIINITTGLIYAPKTAYPFYNATKAALHAFTQTIRMQTGIKQPDIIEVMFPVVDTPWHAGQTPSMAITPDRAVAEMMIGLAKGKKEIRVGKVKLLYLIWRLSPALATRIMNR